MRFQSTFNKNECFFVVFCLLVCFVFVGWGGATCWLVAAGTLLHGAGKKVKELRTRCIMISFHLEALILKLFSASTSEGFILF